MNKLIANKKIAVAMSGGVDSSVAVALCVQNYGKENVFGITMKLFPYAENSAINDAKKVCEKLGIEHFVVDLEQEFKAEIIQNFVTEYQEGRTPNPCVRCNRVIKFGNLLQEVQKQGAEYLATGHYARNYFDEKSKTCRLLKGKDKSKDQSYFLYSLTQFQLQKVLFPLGELTKFEVRNLARKFELGIAEKEESQDICFIPGEVGEFLKDKTNYRRGNIVLTDGTIVGEHSGMPFYTIGQRKGLGGGFTTPMYVIGLDIIKNEIIVGEENELYSNELFLKDINWISGMDPEYPLNCMARIRYQAKEANCSVSKVDKMLKVVFEDSQKAITTGQSVVFYQGDEVVGGGTIY